MRGTKITTRPDNRCETSFKNILVGLLAAGDENNPNIRNVRNYSPNEDGHTTDGLNLQVKYANNCDTRR